MNPINPTVFEIKSVEVVYKADFSPPIFEIALSEIQSKFLKSLCQEFNIKFRDFVFNNQAISTNLIFFRRPLSNPFSYFDSLIGVDEFQTVCSNPKTEIESWMLTLKVLDNLEKLVDLKFNKQTLIIKLHCSSENISYAKFIDSINKYTSKEDIIISKGVSFVIRTPWPGVVLNINFERSIFVDDGPFILIQAFYDESIQDYKDIFTDIISFLINKIESLFKIRINYEGRS